MLSLYDTIHRLCIDKGVNITAMCRECDVSRGSLTDLKMGRKSALSVQALSKIADYFSVSVDYLLGKETEKKPTTLSGDEQKRVSVAETSDAEENIVIFHRDGKMQIRQLTKEQLVLFHALVDAIPESPKDL